MSTEFDIATALLRVALGVMLAAHGWNKMFGAGGLGGTTGWFEALGLRPARVHAVLAAVTELGAGVLMVAGLFTPAAVAAFVGLMAVAAFTDHRRKGYFVFKGGCEYTVLVGMVAPVLALIGPGRWSLDHVLGLRSSGLGWAAASVGVGLLLAALLLASSYRPGPATTGA